MSGKRVIAIVLSVILDILSLIIGAIVIFASIFSGNLLGALLAFVIVLGLMIAIPLVGVLITKDRPVKINEKKTINVEGFEEKHLSVKEIKRVASKYQYGFYLGKTARAIINQANLVDKKINEAKEAVNNRFEPNSITWDRYMGVVNVAADTAINNLDMMARRISVLDEKEYFTLTNPIKHLTHRENINSGRLEFYKENKEYIDRGIQDNEDMFNRLDTLSIELRKSADNSTKTDAVIEDIEEMTSQIKYYN